MFGNVGEIQKDVKLILGQSNMIPQARCIEQKCIWYLCLVAESQIRESYLVRTSWCIIMLEESVGEREDASDCIFSKGL